MKLAFITLSVLCTAAFSDSLPLFEELDEQFSQGATPVEKEVSGYWAGHCVQPTSPEMRHPAIYINKMLQDDLEIGVQYRSQSYYWEKNDNADLFLTFTPAEVENYQRIKDWFSKEQWNATQIDDGSIANYFEFTDGTQIIRELRVYETEFDKKLVLKISKRTGLGSEVINYCEYSKFLGKLGGSTPPPAGDNGKPFHFKTDWVSNATMTFENPNPAKPLAEVRIYKNALGKVRLSKVELTFTDGKIMKVNDITMFGFGTSILNPGNGTPFNLQKLKFTVNGSAPFEVLGVPAN